MTKNIFEFTRLAMLNNEQQEKATKLMTLAAMTVLHYGKKTSDLCEDDWSLGKFAFNEEGIALIEDYLKTRIRGRIVKWTRSANGAIEITRVKTLNGLTTGKQEHIDKIYSMINAMSMLLAQCILQECDGLWDFKDGDYIYKAYGYDGFYTFNKCLKFIVLGEEDSLIGFCKAIEHRKENAALVEQLNKKMLEVGFNVNNYKVQQWSTADGRLERICYIDKDGIVAREIIVAAN